MMKQVKAARSPIWSVLVVVAIMLSVLPGCAAHANSGGYAGTYSGSYTQEYDIGVYTDTFVLNGDGTGMLYREYRTARYESDEGAIRYTVDGSNIVITVVSSNSSSSGKIDESGLWINGHLFEKVSDATSVPSSSMSSSISTEANGSEFESTSVSEPDSTSAFAPDNDGAVKPGDEWGSEDRPASSPSADGSSAGSSPDYLGKLREIIENERKRQSGEHPNGLAGSASSAATTASPSSSSASGSNVRSLHFEENGYSVDLPAYWNGRVMVNEPDAYGTMFEVRSKNYPEYILCKIEVVPSRDRMTGGDIAHPNVAQASLPDGRVACVRATNYSWLVTSGTGTMSDAEAAELVDLTTGGKTVADCERASRNGDDLVSAHWIADNVKVTAQR